MRIDFSTLTNNYSGDVDRATETLDMFTQWGMKHVDLIRLCLDSESWPELAMLTKRLKSSLEHIEAREIAKLAERLEASIPPAVMDSQLIFASLQNETAALMAEIQEILDSD